MLFFNNNSNNNNNNNNNNNKNFKIIIIIIILVMMLMVIILIIIIIIAFKGAIRDFLQSPHCAANRPQHIRSSDPGAIVCKSSSTYHVQHVVFRATWDEATAQL